MATLTQAQLLYLIDIKMNSGVNAVLSGVNKRIDNLEKSMNKVTTASKKAGMGLMGFGLSVLFGGMAVKMLATNILTGLVTAFVTARDEGDFLVNRLLAMQASLEFLKFAIFDAFAQSELFMEMTTAIIDMVNSISQFVSHNPRLAQFIVLMLAGLIVLGAFGMVLGQLSLLAVGLGIGLLPIVGIVILISALFAGLFALLTSDVPPVIKLLNGVLFVVGAIFLILALLGIGVSAFASMWIAAGVVVIGGFIMMANHLGGIKQAFAAFGIFALRILATLGDAIVWALLSPLNSVILLINAAIIASNKFLGTNFDTIDFVLPSFGGKVDVMRDQLIAESKAAKASEATTASTESGGITNVFNIDNAFGDDSKLTQGIEEVLKNIGDVNLGSTNRG